MAFGLGMQPLITQGMEFVITASTEGFTRGINLSMKLLKSFGSLIKSTLRTLTSFATRITVLLTGGAFTAAIARAMQSIDNLAKTSRKLGLTTEALTGLRLAAEETGVAARTLDMGVQRMIRRIAEAASGVGEARDALRELGIDAVRLNQLSPDKQFQRIAEAFENVRGQSDRVRLAFKLFDSEGVALVNTLALGRRGLEDMQQEAVRLGLVISDEAARGVERALDAFGRFRRQVFAIFQNIAAELAPFIEMLSTRASNFLSGDRIKTIGSAVAQFMISVAKKAGDAIQRAAAALMRFAAMGIGMMNQFRSSRVAGRMGFAVPTQEDFAMEGRLRNTAAWLSHQRNMPSAIISRTISGIRQQISGEIAAENRQPVSVGGAIGGMLGRAQGALGPSVLTGQQLLGSFIGAAQRGVRAAQMAVANAPMQMMMAHARNFRTGDPRTNPLLSLAEAGTVSGFRQRQQALTQRDRMEIPKKQLKVQEGILDGINGVKQALKDLGLNPVPGF